MKKIVTVVGARPQFIKCAPICRELRIHFKEVLVHTGQHYDEGMSDVFFRELEIPVPDYCLEVGSKSPGAQVAEMLHKTEEVLLREKPDALLVYGDTNSTLAGALAASQRHIPLIHVEAGLRSFNRLMPEEVNRVLTDHLSSLLLCPTKTAIKNLKEEGISCGVHLVGDVMHDTLLRNISLAENKSTILARLKMVPGKYFLATVHRAENTDDPEKLKNLMRAFGKLASRGSHIVFPVHPRTLQRLKTSGWAGHPRILPIEPVSYLDMLMLEKNAVSILTDSGGVQKEAFWLQVPCVTLREETEWMETVVSGWNILSGTDPRKIVQAAISPRPRIRTQLPSGNAISQIVDIVKVYLDRAKSGKKR